MAQSAMPHIEGRVISLHCPKCGDAHFDTGELAFTPHIDHICLSCDTEFRASTQVKKTIGNPFVAVRAKLAEKSPNPLRNDTMGLRIEAI